jgi:glycosyltransferase involved in cell wall biosynthesis
VSQRLVFASRRMPHPLTNGSRVRTSRLLAGLSAAFETTFVVYEHDPEGPDGGCSRQDLTEMFPGVEVVAVPAPVRAKRWAQVRTLASSRSWTYGRYATRAFQEALMGAVERRRPAVVHLDDQGVGHCGPIAGTLSVLATHNVEYRIVRGTAEADRGARGAFAALDWRKLKREEERLWRRMPLCLAVSEVDAATMRAAGARRVEICPNGTDDVQPPAAAMRRHGEPLRLLFVGSASYDPYERGLAWFIREVLPRLQARLPTTLDIVGVPPRRPVSAPGVTYPGPVPAVGPWYEAAHAVIVPVFEGSGTRLKVLEAMAHRRAVVATRIAVEGLPVQAGRHYLRADDGEGFVTALDDLGHRLSGDDAELRRMLDAARDALSPLFWPRIVSRLVDLYRAETAAGGLSRDERGGP